MKWDYFKCPFKSRLASESQVSIAAHNECQSASRSSDNTDRQSNKQTTPWVCNESVHSSDQVQCTGLSNDNIKIIRPDSVHLRPQILYTESCMNLTSAVFCKLPQGAIDGITDLHKFLPKMYGVCSCEERVHIFDTSIFNTLKFYSLFMLNSETAFKKKFGIAFWFLNKTY